MNDELESPEPEPAPYAWCLKNPQKVFSRLQEPAHQGQEAKMTIRNIQVSVIRPGGGGPTKLFDIYDDSGEWVAKFAVPLDVPDADLNADAIMAFQAGAPIGAPGTHAVRLTSYEGILVDPCWK